MAKQQLQSQFMLPSHHKCSGYCLLSTSINKCAKILPLINKLCWLWQTFLYGPYTSSRESYDAESYVSCSCILKSSMLLQSNFSVNYIDMVFFFRSEFGGYLVYFYICDRTNLLGESAKVLLCLYLLLIRKLCLHLNVWLRHYIICIPKDTILFVWLSFLDL